MTLFTILLLGLSAAALAGAAVAVLARKVLRLALGLGTLLIAVAGIFLLYGAALPAVAQVFLYVGGVLVLLLFTLMLLRRDVAGEPQALSDHRPAAAVVSLAVFGVLALGFQPLVAVPGRPVSVDAIGAMLLGPGYLVVFETVAGLLLVVLVAAVALTTTSGEIAPGSSASTATSPVPGTAPATSPVVDIFPDTTPDISPGTAPKDSEGGRLNP
jgi:NADH-quinone oxidoreductase subunit J